jgi:cation transport ATPase
MTPPQFSQFWVGCGFAIFLVIFAIVVFFRRGKLEAHQCALLRFLLALCAGFAGGLISGEALFKLVENRGVNSQLAVSGTAGFALFFTVWFTFPKLADRPAGDYAFTLPDGWTSRTPRQR